MMCLGKGELGIVLRDHLALSFSFLLFFFLCMHAREIMLGFCGAGAMLETP